MKDRQRHMLRIVLGVTSFALACLLALGGCDETTDELGFAPSGCVTTRPSTGQIRLLVTIDTEIRRVPVRIYEGDIEKNRVVVEDTLGRIALSYQLFADRHYSATATYVLGRDTVVAIGSGQITTSKTEFRDADCWSTEHGEIDLQLRVRP